MKTLRLGTALTGALAALAFALPAAAGDMEKRADTAAELNAQQAEAMDREKAIKAGEISDLEDDFVDEQTAEALDDQDRVPAERAETLTPVEQLNSPEERNTPKVDNAGVSPKTPELNELSEVEKLNSPRERNTPNVEQAAREPNSEADLNEIEQLDSPRERNTPEVGEDNAGPMD